MEAMAQKLRVETSWLRTLARREDKRKWSEGVRDLPRLAWLVAPESAYTVAKQYNITMQDSTCNWEKACAARADVIADARFLAQATIAALPQIQTWWNVVPNNYNKTSTLFLIPIALSYNTVGKPEYLY